MSIQRPLRRASPATSPESPEALLISALLEVGTWNPGEYTVVAEDINAWRPLWDWCERYAQRSSGNAPPLSLLAKTFPDFEVTPGVDVAWAAGEVKNASDARMMRIRSKEMITALNEEDLAGAYRVIEEIRPPRTAGARPVSVFDTTTPARAGAQVLFPTPYPTLNRYFGGVGVGELWYLAARTSHGKTWQLLHYAQVAASLGLRVAVLALEMPAHNVALRSLVVATRGDSDLLRSLRSEEDHVRASAVESIAAMMPGAIDVHDLRTGPVNTPEYVQGVLGDYDLVLIDHVGLMTYGGHGAIDDWRVLGQISNTLRRLTLESGTPVIAAAQLNREALRGRASKPPPISAIAGADTLAQDADLLITMRRYSRRVLVQEAVKVREHEEPPKLWTWLDPRKGRFAEMTRDQAESVHDADGGDYRDED